VRGYQHGQRALPVGLEAALCLYLRMPGLNVGDCTSVGSDFRRDLFL